MKKLIAALLLAAMTTPAWGWGSQGHRLVALVAMDHLTPTARKNVKALLGEETLADIASWPDAYRPLETQTGSWHYVDLPADQITYDRDRDCPTQPGVKKGANNDKWRDCVVDRILFFEGRLADAKLDPADRTTALKYLVHFIGDLHQPFHASGVERGGNGIPVVEFGSEKCGGYNCNLHSVWDSGLMQHRNLSEAQYKALLEKNIRKSSPSLGENDPALWASQSKVLSDAAMVGKNASIDEAYFVKEIPVVDLQMELAGLRLASVLNGVFTAPPVKFHPAAVAARD